MYTTVGGIAGVINTDVKQMIVMMFGLIFCFGLIWHHLPEEVGFDGALYLAGSLDKLTALDLNFDLTEKYNIWSGVIAAFFLMVSYFGTDQTQVQRYLTTDSVKNARKSLLLTAYAKVPMQFFILLLGVMLYVFFIFNSAPASFRQHGTSCPNRTAATYRTKDPQRLSGCSFSQKGGCFRCRSEQK
ncbi:MAG: hypothetical protein U5K71_12890 [Gracilimonas sp.]|nr:hypothetical protein [Gracilimonas sp.]